MREIPEIGQTVFYSAHGKVKTAIVESLGIHAANRTPFVNLVGSSTCLHPAYIHTTSADAIKDADKFNTAFEKRPTIDNHIRLELETAKLSALAPEFRKAYARGLRNSYEGFKQDQAGKAIQYLIPGTSLVEANRRFIDGMAIFRALQEAYSHVHCYTFTQAMREELSVGQHIISNSEDIINMRQFDDLLDHSGPHVGISQ